MSPLFIIALLSVAIADITCTTNEVYVKVIKASTSYASEESFTISGNGVVLQTSPAFANNEVRTVEYCIAATTNNQYTVKLADSYGDSWSNGAYLQFEGINGNRAFKIFMAENYEESYTLSLYAPINKSDSWKFTASTVTGNWFEYNFADSAWTEVTLGSVTTPVTTTQYFRKTFAGLPNMAAYEVAFNYRYGIVAYVNGVEIFRDNMPEGVPTSATLAIGSYQVVEYHNLIRSGSEVANTQSILAVEIHLLNNIEYAVDFNAFLAIYAPDTSEANCFVYPYTTSVTGGGNSPSYLFDFSRSNSFSATTFPTEVTYSLSGPKAYINGFRVWPYTSYTSAPSSLALQGAQSSTATTWNNVLLGNNLVYESSVYKTVLGYFNAGMYTTYKLRVLSSTASTSYIYEGQLVTCNAPPPATIEFSSASYNYYALYDDVYIAPVVSEFTACTINPPAPAGLTFDATTCTLSGNAEAASTSQYTVTSTMNGQQYTGSFTLQITTCAGTLVNVLRTYGSNAGYESFSIKDTTTQQSILSVADNSGQAANTDYTYLLCLTGSKYDIQVGSTSTYWYYNSFLYVNTILGGDEKETMIRVKYDTYNGLSDYYSFNAQYAIKGHETWNYKMGEVPANWYSNDMSGWATASFGTFPASTSQIQLYKKTFNVASITNMAGVVISLRYQYGVIIYLNGHEAFRKGVAGDLTTTTYSSTSLENVQFRQISLPIKTIATDSAAAVDYITTGTNTIAIALVAVGPAQTAATFDCAVRLMGDESYSRVHDASVSYSGIYGSPSYILYHSYSYYMYYDICATNYLQINFNNDRHEWISSVAIKLYYSQNDQQPRQFVLKAKNNEDTEWTTLKTVTTMFWSLAGQRNRIWINNSKAYNQYRFENIGTGNPDACYWKIGMLDLLSDSTVVNVPALSYPQTTSIFKDIEMAEIYPNSDLYTDFTINPPLPTGVVIDSNTGTISGTASTVSGAVTYTISAKKFTGEAVTAQMSLTVEICTGGKSLITMVVRTDSWPSEASYKLYQGKGTTGTVLSSIDAFVVVNNLNYGDFCLNNGLYTLEFKDTYGDGWVNPAGYYLSVDVGAFKFEMGQVPTAAPVTTMFSSYLPFQVEYDDWKVYKNTEAVSESWNTVNFDDSTWTITKAANIGTSEAVTVYIRKEVTIDDIANYYVLNVRVKYAGGVVAYFNGRKIARFNLDEEFDSTTESIAIHDSSKFSFFHVLLATSGAVTGKNVIAFEIHRPFETSSAEPIVFDATGVFGVNDCSVVLDTVINVEGTEATEIGDLSNFFELTPVTFGYQPNVVGTYLQWEVENLEGTRFNSFALQTVYAYNWGYSLYARDESNEQFTSIFDDPDITSVLRSRTRHAVPAGIANFNQFKWQIDVAATGTEYISAYLFEYCKPAGTSVCPGVDDYPTVAEGEISPGDCPRGYRGYSYRECAGGVLGPVKNDKCTYRIPSNMRYRQNRVNVVLNTNTHVEPPFYRNIITRFYLAENTFLPNGLVLDETTGAITGKATEMSGLKTYTIYGENPAGVAYTTINIQVRKGECMAEGNFPKTEVGSVATYECSTAGSYVGTQKRACLLGEKDGEWQKIQGTCMPIFMIVLLVIIGLIVLAVGGLIVMRATKKTKAVGGVKSKKTSGKNAKTTKAPTKKAPTKSVKV